MFRKLYAEEIECRVSTVSEKGVSLLLYKDARCDMNILDETVGPMNWQRSHCRDNANCIISIWDKEKMQWISKEDTGTESFTEKEKGLASDSFKRAGFNWGIGRELYTAPFIWVPNGKVDIKSKGNGHTTYDKFTVTEIGYDDKGCINQLVIRNNTKKLEAYVYGSSCSPEPEKPKSEKPVATRKTLDGIKLDLIKSEMKRTGITLKTMLHMYNVTALEYMTVDQFKDAIDKFKKTPDKMPLADVTQEELPFK